MQKTIFFHNFVIKRDMKNKPDIKLIKENPDLFFSQLDKEAEKEFANIFEYFVFKHNIKIDDRKTDTSSSKKEREFLRFIENNKIILPENFKFNREEAHDR